MEGRSEEEGRRWKAGVRRWKEGVRKKGGGGRQE